MKFLRSLFGKTSPAPEPAPVAPPKAAVPAPMPAPARKRRPPAAPAGAPPQAAPAEDPMATTQILQNLAERLKEPSATGIWDLEEEGAAPAPQTGRTGQAAYEGHAPNGPIEEMVAQTAPRSSRRNKTRLIGFDGGDTSVVDLFGDEEAASPALSEAQAAPAAAASTFPVGWVVVVHGPGRGHAFPLGAGLSSIGRGDDQTVPLAFGDAAISRQSHAAIVYDAAARSFTLGQGGKSNIVRLNGKPVIANEEISDGDDIKIGETILKLKTLCGPDFDWADTDGEEDDDDVAIA